MGPDLPEEADVPPDGHVDRRDDQSGNGRTARPGSTEAETRSHEECYNDLRVAEAKEKSVTAQRISAEEQAAVDTWNEKATGFRWIWTEYQRKWPPEERRPVDRSSGPPGSWRGEGGRELEVEDNSRVEAACDRIAELREDHASDACHRKPRSRPPSDRLR